tara:strand:+ start:656 stop:832 length:177 start_codon:yes stop_codon:yes gene_type:complete
MDIQRERLITKILEQPLEELLKNLNTNEVQVLFIYINQVVDKKIKDRFDRDMAKLKQI